MSITERPVDPALKALLVNNSPFQYAHLIKFERPSRPDTDTGLISTAKQRYTYLTDASINVQFDDGSTDLLGNQNGLQTYIANKVLNVGPIQEQTKATTSSTSIVLDGTALGADITGTATISSAGTGYWDVTYAAPISTDDLLAEGFREGDKVKVNDIPVNIDSFRANNVLRVSKIDTDLTPAISISVRLKLASEEIISILLNKNATDYASFINREVYIYRAYFTDGTIVGAPILLFKGIISSVNFEDSESAIKVTWGLSSHWADFSQVKARLTSDSFHRALDENGRPQPAAALKPSYAYDKGFSHSETSINVLAKYVVQVQKQDVSGGGGGGILGFIGGGLLGGLLGGSSVSVKTYNVPEDRFTRLDFQLQAKSIPVIYGVRKTPGLPVFADTLNDDSSIVYVASVLSEGEIGGIYDVYINGNSLICSDKTDYDARHLQTSTNTVELTCMGRADRGEVLGGVMSAATPYYYYGNDGELISISSSDLYNGLVSWSVPSYQSPVSVNTSDCGIIDGQSINLTIPQGITLDVFSGKPGQKASAQLCQIAYDKNFKIQNTYWLGNNTTEYWGPNHKLLDSAYIVGKYKIVEGETTIPDINYVVRGKVLQCYNYDYSFLHDRKASTESADNFPLGSVVSLYDSATNSVINSSTQIIDKWLFKNPDGTSNYRFRFDQVPALNFTNGVPAIKKFYMKNASNNTWTMTTFNYERFSSASIVDTIAQTITSKTSSSGYVAFNLSSTTYLTVENDPVETSATFQVVVPSTTTPGTYDNVPTGNLLPFATMTGTWSGSTFITGYPDSAFSTETLPTGALLASKNTARLPSVDGSGTAANSTDDFYTGDIVEITRYNSYNGTSMVQSATIIGYNGASRILTVDSVWDFIPVATDKIRIYPRYADSRVSINPAIQTLDYVTAKTYGKGLDINKDIDLPSWTDTARKCDTRSDVTLLCTSTSGVVTNSIYKYPATGNIIWQGTIGGISGNYITCTNVIGKITNKWTSWKSYNVGEIIYSQSTNTFYRIDSPGTICTEPTFSGGTNINPTTLNDGSTCTSLTNISTLIISRVTTSGPVSITLDLTNGNPVQSLNASGQKISGYSVYDCDDISYWRYSGWDEHSQRYVTKNQTNLIIDTSQPLSDNTNALLEHFNGIIRYTGGKYYLDIESAEGTVDSLRTLTVDDIIGNIQLTDEGTRSAFNSLTAAYSDPSNKFEARNISFFNSNYLKSDRNVPKKGNLSVPGITNYYNTRLLADSFLNKSRFGLNLNLTTRTHGVLLLAGTVIQINYPRYDWTSPGKKFRIDTITHHPDGLSDIVAKEYDDSFYSLSNIKAISGTGATTLPVTNSLGSPTNLTVTSADTTDELLNGVVLYWDNDPSADSSTNAFTEVYGSLSQHLYITTISIASNVLTTSVAHGLVPGMPIYPESTSNGITSDSIYYVVATPSSTTFTVTSTKNSTTPDTLTNGSSLALKFRTATLLGTVPVPIRSFTDTVVNEGTGRVEKYYWVRHKVNRI